MWDSIKKYGLIIFLPLMLVIAGCSNSGSSDGGLLEQGPGSDIDGDGIPNVNDGDVDGDGVPNELDPDNDNDGIPDTIDPVPQPDPKAGQCTYINIIAPNDDQGSGDTVIVRWTVHGAGGNTSCEIPSTGKKDPALAYNNGGLDPNPAESLDVSVADKQAAIQLPKWCQKDVTFTYNLERIAAQIDHTTESAGASFSQAITHKRQNNCNDAQKPELEPLSCEGELVPNGGNKKGICPGDQIGRAHV